jgi:hypothetical protein
MCCRLGHASPFDDGLKQAKVAQLDTAQDPLDLGHDHLIKNRDSDRTAAGRCADR